MWQPVNTWPRFVHYGYPIHLYCRAQFNQCYQWPEQYLGNIAWRATLVNDFIIEGDALAFTGFLDNGAAPFTSGSIIVAGVDFAGDPVPNAGTPY